VVNKDQVSVSSKCVSVHEVVILLVRFNQCFIFLFYFTSFVPYCFVFVQRFNNGNSDVHQRGRVGIIVKCLLQ